MKKHRRVADDEASEEESGSDAPEPSRRPQLEIADVGGGPDDIADDELHDVPPGELSSFPFRDMDRTFALCFQQDEFAALSMKTRKSQSDLNLKDIAETYGPLLQQDFSVDVAAAGSTVFVRGAVAEIVDILCP